MLGSIASVALRMAIVAFVIGSNLGATACASVTPPATLARFGLLGVWSPDCIAPASRANPRVIFGVSNGQVVHSVSFDGQTTALINSVASATILNDHDLKLSLTGRKQDPGEVIVRLVKDHVWTIYSASTGGHVFYSQGIEVSTGRPSLVDERCEALTS